MEEGKRKFDKSFIWGLVMILFASLISWTFFFLIVSILAYPIGVLLIFRSSRKLWLKIIAIIVPVPFSFPLFILLANKIEYLML